MTNDDEEDESGIRKKFWAEQMRMDNKHAQKQWNPEVNILLINYFTFFENKNRNICVSKIYFLIVVNIIPVTDT